MRKQYRCSNCGSILADLPTVTVEKIVEKKVEIPIEKIVYKDRVITDETKIKELTATIQTLQRQLTDYKNLYEQERQKREQPKKKEIIINPMRIIRRADE